MKKLALTLVLSVLLAACGDDPSGPDANAHVGTYALATVNGSAVPTSLGTVEGFEVTVLSGSLSLNSDQTASVLVRFRLTQGTFSAEDTVDDTGTYTRTGTSILVTWSEGDQDTFAFDEGRGELTATVDGDVLVFRK